MPLLNIIDGVLVAPTTTLGQFLRNANTGTVLEPQADTDSKAVESALEAADRVHKAGVWSALTVSERCAHLLRVASEIAKVCGCFSVYVIFFYYFVIFCL
jgi:acyl-CoA reductase-like NAD-dependent aldehyde dehydrogenase